MCSHYSYFRQQQNVMEHSVKKGTFRAAFTAGCNEEQYKSEAYK